MPHLKSVLLLAMCIGVWQIAAASSDTGTLLVGEISSTTCSGTGRPLPYYYGFTSSPAVGSYSPTGLAGGKTVIKLFDYLSCGALSELWISGFSSNPGQSWLSSVACNGVTNTGAGAFDFSYNSGTASWVWNDRFGFQSKYGSNVSCTIVHN